MTTAERNIIIAVFMGYKYDPESTLNGIKGVLLKDGELTLHSDVLNSRYCPKYHSSWDWQIQAWSKAIQQYDLPRKSVYKVRYAIAIETNNHELGHGILTELIIEINQNKKHSLVECTCDRDLKYCKHPDLCESDKL